MTRQDDKDQQGSVICTVMKSVAKRLREILHDSRGCSGRRLLEKSCQEPLTTRSGSPQNLRLRKSLIRALRN